MHHGRPNVSRLIWGMWSLFMYNPPRLKIALPHHHHQIWNKNAKIMLNANQHSITIITTSSFNKQNFRVTIHTSSWIKFKFHSQPLHVIIIFLNYTYNNIIHHCAKIKNWEWKWIKNNWINITRSHHHIIIHSLQEKHKQNLKLKQNEQN